MQRGCYTLQTASSADDDGSISAPARDPLIIEDPTNPTNNIGRTCFGVALLQRALSDALCSLHAANHAECYTEDGTALRKRAQTNDCTTTSMLGRLFKTTHHSRVVELIKRTWCPADPTPILPVEGKRVVDAEVDVHHELEAVKADRDAWKERATAAEKRAAELEARVEALEHAARDGIGERP